jgi:CBS-domain-containing membrane protein
MLGFYLSDSRPLVFTGGLFNESRDSLGMREVDGVAALASTTVEPARLAIARWASAGILLSSVATKYQLGFVLQAGSLIAPLKHATPHGT